MLRSFKSRFGKGSSASGSNVGGSASDDEGSAPTGNLTSAASATATRPRIWSRKSSQERLSSLANFDACVHAADGLGTSSASTERAILSDRRDKQTGLVDCSVLVSPDGDLLLVNQGSARTLFQNKAKVATSASNEGGETAPGDSGQEPPDHMFSQLIAQGKDDYEASVFLGNDLVPDRELNLFSAKGWSFAAASHALYQTEHTMKQWLAYVQAMTMQRHSNASAALHDTLKWQQLSQDSLSVTSPSSWRGKSNMAIRGSDWELIDPRAGEFEVGADRVGPLRAPESSTLFNAVQAFEKYQTSTAKADLDMMQKSVLPGQLEKATQQLSKRVENRQQALAETSRRVRIMEDRLVHLKQASDKSWEAVYQAEAKVTKKVEQVMKNRRKNREKERLAQLRKQQDESASEDAGPTRQAEEIWDMVSAVSVEDASFEPMELGELVDDAASVASSVKSSEPPLPTVSRENIEHEVGLPELRASALKADAEIDEAAGDLLTLLSSLDTTRRSARAAAETCLVAAGNAQAASLKSMIQLERACLEQRLASLSSLEAAVEEIDVRSDLDQYIQKDKTGRGGSSHLGDDDDGGVASALATLSSHVDGILGGETTSRKNTGSSMDMLIQGLEDDETTVEKIEASLEQLFADIPELKDDAERGGDRSTQVHQQFDEAVHILCKTALDDRRLGRRSVLCYKLNARRSTRAEIRTRKQFDGLCKVFSAILSGCQTDQGEVSNAKMCIMLAQTFYLLDEDNSEEATEVSGSVARSRRIFIRSELTDHPIWAKDEFWYVHL